MRNCALCHPYYFYHIAYIPKTIKAASRAAQNSCPGTKLTGWAAACVNVTEGDESIQRRYNQRCLETRNNSCARNKIALSSFHDPHERQCNIR